MYQMESLCFFYFWSKLFPKFPLITQTRNLKDYLKILLADLLCGWWSTLKLCLLVGRGCVLWGGAWGGGEEGEEGAVLLDDVAGVEEEDEEGEVRVVELEESEIPPVAGGGWARTVCWGRDCGYKHKTLLL